LTKNLLMVGKKHRCSPLGTDPPHTPDAARGRWAARTGHPPRCRTAPRQRPATSSPTYQSPLDPTLLQRRGRPAVQRRSSTARGRAGAGSHGPSVHPYRAASPPRSPPPRPPPTGEVDMRPPLAILAPTWPRALPGGRPPTDGRYQPSSRHERTRVLIVLLRDWRRRNLP
jgi:hypothetical protein